MCNGKFFLIYCIAAVTAVLHSCSSPVTDPDVAGTNDEILVRTAKIYDTKYAAAAGVTVKVYAVDDTSRIPVFDTTTDASGEYYLDVDNGLYNVMAGDNEHAAFQDSVVIATIETSTLNDDTLVNAIIVKGTVLLEPIHDPRTVTIQILGTGKHANVDKQGNFTINALPEGVYTLLAVSTVDEYTPTYTSFNVEASEEDTMYITVDMIYTGIPVVTIENTEYDTLMQTITMRWDSLDYHILKDFVIYRALGDSGTLEYNEIGHTTAYTYTDTLPEEIPSSVVSYKIAARSATMETGKVYEEAVINTKESFHLTIHASECYLGLPCTLQTERTGYTGSAIEYTWDIGATGSFSDASSPDTVITIHDTLVGSFPCIVKTVIDKKVTCFDTIYLTTGFYWDKVAPPAMENAEFVHTVCLNDEFISFYGNANHGSIWKIDTLLQWSKVSESSQFTKNYSKPEVFENTICVVDPSGYLWSSPNGSDWHQSDAPVCSTSVLPTAVGPEAGSLRAPCLFGYKGMLCIQPFAATAQGDSLLATYDLITWSSYPNDLKITVYDYTVNNNDTAYYGYDWTDSSCFSAWLVNPESDGFLSLRFPPASAEQTTMLLLTGKFGNAYNHSITPFLDRLIYSGNTELLKVCDLYRNTWYETPFPASMGERDEPPTLIVYRDYLYAVGVTGIYRIRQQ